MAEDQWNERRQRHPVQLMAKVSRADCQEAEVAVSNLSLEGCCLEGWFQIGERLTIVLPRIGKLQGCVRWALFGRAGVLFDKGER